MQKGETAVVSIKKYVVSTDMLPGTKNDPFTIDDSPFTINALHHLFPHHNQFPAYAEFLLPQMQK